MAFRKLSDEPFNKWFERFLEEKELPYADWFLEDKQGQSHFIDTDVVIEAIKTAPPNEQKQIQDMIVKIDFANGDVNDYFKFLAEAYINQGNWEE